MKPSPVHQGGLESEVSEHGAFSVRLWVRLVSRPESESRVCLSKCVQWILYMLELTKPRRQSGKGPWEGTDIFPPHPGPKQPALIHSCTSNLFLKLPNDGGTINSISKLFQCSLAFWTTFKSSFKFYQSSRTRLFLFFPWETQRSITSFFSLRIVTLGPFCIS